MSLFCLKSLKLNTFASQITAATLSTFRKPKIDSEITKLCSESRVEEGLGILNSTNNRNLQIDRDRCLSLVQICTDKRILTGAKSVHTLMMKKALIQHDVYLSTKIISMYVVCQSLDDARQVFDEMPERNVYSWNSILRGYIKNGLYEESLGFYYQMLKDGIEPDRFTFPYVLKACSGISALEEGEKVHDLVCSRGFESDVVVASALIDMYAKCGSLENARQVFDKIPQPDLVAWSAMIGGFAQNDRCEDALMLFKEMALARVRPDVVTIASVLPACGRLGALHEGKQIHGYVVASGFSDVYVMNALIDMYAKCGCVEDSRQVFDKMSEKDVISCNSIIVGYAQNGHCLEALEAFQEMKMLRLKPNESTLTGVFAACCDFASVRPGKEIHTYVVKSGLESNVFVGSALIDMYSKWGTLKIARRVFDQMAHRDLVLWNSMIAGYAQNGHCHEALELFQEIQPDGLKPNVVTLISILPLCASLESVLQGKGIHGYMVKHGLEREFVAQCALIDMYSKCGAMDIAQLVFERGSTSHVVLWNSMICGYAHNGFIYESFKLFCQIQELGMKPDSGTLTGVLPAFSQLANMQKGKEIHDYIIRNGFDADVSIGNALIDMYAKCGSIEKCRIVFDKMWERDLVSWNAIIVGYGVHGHGNEALNLFHQMQKTGLQPDYITFVALLSACSRAGLVDEGWEVFESMNRDYHIIPGTVHYACMVDLLGRAGHLKQAKEFIEKMPQKPGAIMWGSLLGACKVHRDIEMAEYSSKQLFKLNSDNAGYYVLLSNIYASAGMWVDVNRVRALMKNRGVKKKPGCSWIEADNRFHAFRVGDRSHPQSDKIYAKLESLTEQMKEEGYVPDTAFALHDAVGS